MLTNPSTPPARQRVLLQIKLTPGVSITELAERLGFTYEAARQQVGALEREGWVRSEHPPRQGRGVGRPLARYRLTVAGEHLFPKHYDRLAGALIATAARALGPDAMRGLLATITEQRVAEWRPLLEGRTLEEKLELLKELYVAADPYTEVVRRDGELRLVERNCPFLNTAMDHPELCSTSVMTLQRLLGYRVVREERFQAGDGRCVFRIDTGRPVDPGQSFELEEPPSSAAS